MWNNTIIVYIHESQTEQETGSIETDNEWLYELIEEIRI